MRLILIIVIVFSAALAAAQQVDISLYYDDDPTNDPNLCHYTNVCKDEHDWTWGWHALRKALGLPYSRAHVGDDREDVVSSLRLRKTGKRGKDGNDDGSPSQPTATVCEDPVWFQKCLGAYPGDVVCDEDGMNCSYHTRDGWRRGCWVGYCGCS